jgi:hypothetical protein
MRDTTPFSEGGLVSSSEGGEETPTRPRAVSVEESDLHGNR